MGSPYASIMYGIDLGSDEEREWELPEWFSEYPGFHGRLSDILGIPEAGDPPMYDRDNQTIKEYYATPERVEWQKLHDARQYPLGLAIEYYGDGEYGSGQILIVQESQIETEWGAVKFDPTLLTHTQYTSEWDNNIEKALTYLKLDLPEDLEPSWHLAPYYSS